MSRPSRQGFVEKVERKVHSLRASGFAPEELRLGVLVTLEQGLPLRDSIVLRNTRRLSEAATPAARAGWEQARAALRQAVPATTNFGGVFLAAITLPDAANGRAAA